MSAHRRSARALLDVPAGWMAMRQRMVVLADAQIKALPTTGIEVVPARAGITHIVSPPLSQWWVDTTAGAYVAAAAASWSLLVGPNEVTGSALVRDALQAAGIFGHHFISDGDNGVGAFSGTFVSNFHPFSERANQPVLVRDFFGGVANYTGGNAANRARICVAYLSFDETLGVYV